MSWVYLFVAGIFEIGWAIGLKYTNGFTRLVPTLLTAASMVVSLGLLGLALKTLPVGTAYAVWTGIGRSAPRSSASTCSASRPPPCGLPASGSSSPASSD